MSVARIFFRAAVNALGKEQTEESLRLRCNPSLVKALCSWGLQEFRVGQPVSARRLLRRSVEESRNHPDGVAGGGGIVTLHLWAKEERAKGKLHQASPLPKLLQPCWHGVCHPLPILNRSAWFTSPHSLPCLYCPPLLAPPCLDCLCPDPSPHLLNEPDFPASLRPQAKALIKEGLASDPSNPYMLMLKVPSPPQFPNSCKGGHRPDKQLPFLPVHDGWRERGDTAGGGAEGLGISSLTAKGSAGNGGKARDDVFRA